MNSASHRTPTADERLRAEQVEEAHRLEAGGLEGFRRRPVLGVTRPARLAASPTKPVRALKGHEAFLKALELSGANVIIEKMNGDQVEGLVKHSDKYTITMRAGGEDRVIFKHDISEFKTTTPRADTTAQAGQRV